jgi:superoxide reductase
MSEAPALAPVHTTADRSSADDFTKKHTPVIGATRRADGKLDVRIAVGEDVSHPNEPGHWIEWITLLVGEAPIARFTFAASVGYPIVSVVVDVPAGTTLRAIESCNLHGLWAAEITAL